MKTIRFRLDNDAVRIGVTLVALALLFFAGEWVYHTVGWLLFKAQGTPVVPAPLILAIGVLGGAASFFSPCSLVITPTFLMYFVGNRASMSVDMKQHDRSLFMASLLIALGIIGFYGVAAVLVGMIGPVIYRFMIYLIPVVGILFAILGFALLIGGAAALSGAARFLPGRRYYDQLLAGAAQGRRRDLLGFGVAYGAAAHTCTLPVFLGVIMLPLAAGVYWLAALAVLLYGTAMAGLMLLMLALGQPAVLAVRRHIGLYLQPATGILFLLTSAYLSYYFLLNFGLISGI